ncbi:MAG: GAF domain-containing protein [Anaerolineales bacterium]|nr:GAF domain-containing protein [Anaerolineales bacterium]
MNQSRTRNTWRLFLWFIAFSLLSSGVVFFLVQREVRNQNLAFSLSTQLSIALIVAAALASGVIFFLIIVPLSKIEKYTQELESEKVNAELDEKVFPGGLVDIASNLKAIAKKHQNVLKEFKELAKKNELEMSRRNNLLKAISDVGKATTSFRNISELLQQTTQLIHTNFGHYHVGIFLLDERGEYAVLTASNSEGGLRLLEKNHQLKVGETSIVGYVTANAKARIALDVGQDATYFNNPDLPKTRSEIALPLVVGGQVLGALDVQSIEAQAFGDDDISTLQILAEQIAITIQNAKLYEETQKALESARVIYGELSREAWSKILHNQPRFGYIATQPATVETHGGAIEPSLAKAFDTGDLIIGDDGLTISVPIKIRGQVIGAIRLKKSDISEAWTQEESNLAIALSDQLSGALESARLYRESQQRAARESMVSDISTRISSVSSVDAILRETVQELGQALGNAAITFQLLDHNDEQKPTGDSRGSANRSLER